jgi:hypothetical protein
MKYPACNGIRDASSLPPTEMVFLEWLKKMYPAGAMDK